MGFYLGLELERKRTVSFIVVGYDDMIPASKDADYDALESFWLSEGVCLIL